jgi:hypothetical protein
MKLPLKQFAIELYSESPWEGFLVIVSAVHKGVAKRLAVKEANAQYPSVKWTQDHIFQITEMDASQKGVLFSLAVRD